MRAATTVVVLGTIVTAASASGAERGQLGIHVGVTPTEHREAFGRPAFEPGLSFSYQATERLSLRPAFSLGYSDAGGWTWTLGGTALYQLRPGKRLGPYVGAGLRYRARDAFGTARPDPLGLGIDVASLPLGLTSRHHLAFSAIAGAEYSISRRLSLFAEVEGTYRTGRHYGFDGRDWRLGKGGFGVRPIAGLTLKLR